MTDTPDPTPDDALEPGDDFGEQKEQVDKWLEDENQEREEHERQERGSWSKAAVEIQTSVDMEG